MTDTSTPTALESIPVRASRLVALLGLTATFSWGCAPVVAKPAAGGTAASLTPPATQSRPVTDIYHGVRVQEHFRWLEDWDDDAVRRWTEQQNVHARRHLDELPSAPGLRERVEAVLKGATAAYSDLSYAAGSLFAQKLQPPKQQRLLIVTQDPFDPAAIRIVLDPNELDRSGATSIDWYVPSHDGKLVAVSLSKGGTEIGDLHIFDVATGARVHEIVPRVNTGTAGGHLAWEPGNRGFYYTRHPRGNERAPEDMSFYQQLYYHALGTPTEEDRYEIGDSFPRIAEIEVAVDVPTGRVLVTVQNGDGGEFAHYLRQKDGTWTPVSAFGDRVVQVVFGKNDTLFALSRADAPRGKLVRVPVSNPNAHGEGARLILPEGEDTLVNSFWGSSSLVVTDTHLYAKYQLGGPSEIRAFDHDGNPLPKPNQPAGTAIGGLTKTTGDTIAFMLRSFVAPPAVHIYDPGAATTRTTAIKSYSPARFDGVEVVRELATSKDGTRVPVTILKPAGIALDGSHPLILYGYGGYGVTIQPYFSATNSIFLENGVLYAIANIRGGGEFGETWHLQGNLTHKQNVFDDFDAVARHLIQRGYTSHGKLGLRGGSNGGLLMGAMLTQHPDLAAAVVSHVGIYDMLRVELSPNGAFNVTEFGTVANPDHFRAMRAYSPLHNVKNDVSYPAVLMLTGVNDPRVDPMHSRKMTARLQAANQAGGPILLRTSYESGHGQGTPLDERIDQLVDELAFYFEHLAVEHAASPTPGA